MNNQFFILLLFCSSLCYGQDNYENDRLIRKKNNVQEVHSYGYSLELKDSVLFKIEYYDTNGRLMMLTHIEENGEIDWPVRHYEYDKFGFNNKSYSLNKFGDTSRISLWHIGKNGSSQAKKYVSENGEVSYGQMWLYNQMGKDTALINKDSNGDNYIAYIKKYDEEGRELISTDFNEDGSIENESVAEYDTKGNLIGWYDIVNGKRKLSVAYEYDNKNQMIHRKYTITGGFYVPDSFNSDEADTDKENVTKVTMSYKWDLDGNMIEKSRAENGKTVDIVRFFFVKTGS